MVSEIIVLLLLSGIDSGCTIFLTVDLRNNTVIWSATQYFYQRRKPEPTDLLVSQCNDIVQHAARILFKKMENIDCDLHLLDDIHAELVLRDSIKNRYRLRCSAESLRHKPENKPLCNREF